MNKVLLALAVGSRAPELACLCASGILTTPSLRRARWRLGSASLSADAWQGKAEGAAADGEGNGKTEEKKGEEEAKPEHISIESAEDQEPVAAAAAALTDNQIGSVQSPASVWLPYRDTNTGRNKLRANLGPTVVTIGGRLGRALIQFLRLPGHILNLLSFKAQQTMLASTGTKLVAVFVTGIPMCLLGGIVYAWTSGKTLIDGFVNAYGALYKIPGVMVIGEVNHTTAHVMNILWMLGTFTFAITLGLVTEDIVNHVINIKKGNYDVVAANHTLILGWNSQGISLLRQIATNKLERPGGAYDGPVVILSNQDKEELDEELRAALKGFSLEWHTRMGVPHSIADLQRVAAGQAKNVILLNSDNEEDIGKKQVAAILGVQSARTQTKPRPFLKLQTQRIAVQVPENANDKDIIGAARDIMIASAQKFKLTYLSCKRDMSTLLALSAIQPGVASVYCTIVQQTRDGVEFYLKNFPELEGKTFQQARRMFDSAVLCGYMRRGEGGVTEMHLNPQDSDILQEHDRVIALSQTGLFEVAKRTKQQEQQRLVGSEVVEAASARLEDDPSRLKRKHIVVAWYEPRIGDLVDSLARFAPPGSSVTVIAKEKPEDFPEEQRVGHVSLRFVEGEPATRKLLQEAGVAVCDSVIIGGSEDSRSGKEADAMSLALVMLIQECLAGAGRDDSNPSHIVGMVRRPDSIQVANYLMERMGKGSATAELIHPDELVAGVISQVAAEPDIGELLASFVYNNDGSEIHLRRPERYMLPEDKDISFAQISEVCRSQHEIAIGYISENGEVKIAPRGHSIKKFTHSDRILTIAESS